MFLFDDLAIWIGEKMKEMVDQELYGDREKVMERLLTLQTRLDMGEISDEEYRLKEKEILEILEGIDQGGTQGGPEKGDIE